MFSFFLLDFLFMKLNEEKWKRPFSKFTFNRHQHKMSLRQQWKNDQGSKGWRSGESNRPPPSAVARASNPGVDAICEWLSPLLQDVFLLPLFRFSLLLKNRHSTFNVESMGTFAQVFHNVKVLSGKKKIPIYNFIYDRHYGWIVLESLSDETKQRKFHLKNSKSQPPSTTLLS